MRLISHYRKLKRLFSKHSPLIEICISKSHLLHNLHSYQQTYPEVAIAPVLKSNAYGHGLIHVAEILDGEKLPFFVLDSFFEAQALKRSGIKTKLLIIGYTKTETLLREKNDFTYTITCLNQLEELAEKTKRDIRIHLKFDTGMHRQGLAETELEEAISLFGRNSLLRLEGVCSHFADADSVDPSYSHKQIQSWERIVEHFTQAFSDSLYFHISATAGARFTDSIPGNLLRLGLGLYGIDPAPDNQIKLKPVLQMNSIISSVRSLSSGDRIGYNCTYTIEKPSVFATVPVGYYEGVDRRLSNHGVFKVGELDCKILGRVSMNISSIDVTGVENTKRGDIVTIISDNPTDNNSIERIAEICGTIPWEILVHIPSNLYRKVID